MQEPSILAYVLRAKNRIKVLSALKSGNKVSGQLEKETGMYKSHMSRTLQELQDKKLVKCINPNDRDFKFYVLTSKGKRVLSKATKIIEVIKKVKQKY